jgi:DNA-directed RNA polymerase subunit RPC12/RpoP
MKTKPDWIFKCRKCNHEVYMDKKKDIRKFLTLDCPECGEEPFENWVLIGDGNFEKLNS